MRTDARTTTPNNAAKNRINVPINSELSKYSFPFFRSSRLRTRSPSPAAANGLPAFVTAAGTEAFFGAFAFAGLERPKGQSDRDGDQDEYFHVVFSSL